MVAAGGARWTPAGLGGDGDEVGRVGGPEEEDKGEEKVKKERGDDRWVYFLHMGPSEQWYNGS